MGDSRLRRFGIDGRVVGSGLVAGAGFLAAMAFDLAIVKNQADDLVLLGGLVPVEERRWRPVGAILHFVNSVGLAVAYIRLRPHLPKTGNRYLQGLIFIQPVEPGDWLTSVVRSSSCRRCSGTRSTV